MEEVEKDVQELEEEVEKDVQELEEALEGIGRLSWRRSWRK